ncbi:MAG: hypothetical protein QHJ73_01615, partial [Armatimonadota bacterium]|nr:hypothetical protein [Armatimonadota bacterium]
MASSTKCAAQIELDLRVAGQRALVIAETGDSVRAEDLARFLRQTGWEVRTIVAGVVGVFAIRAEEGAAPLEEVERGLKRRYRMVVCEPGFSDSLYRVARELAETAEAEFIPVEKCVVCGQPDPFPTVLSAFAPTGHRVSAPYCAHCVSS